MTPVSNFRWKSLKAYLQDQAALIRPEDVIAAARHQHQRRSRHQQRSYPDVRENKTDNPPARRRVQSSSAGPAAEPPRTRAAKPKDQHLVSSSSSPDMAQLLQEELDGQVVAKASPYLSAGFAASNASMPLAVPSLQMPPRRFSTPMPDQPVSSSITSSSKLTEPVMVTSHDPYDVPISRSFMGPRPSSPSAYSERPRSVWSSFNRLRRSNGSAFSLAPSGASMMDMHVGLSIDRHYPRSPGARYEAAQHIDQMEKAKAAHETENVANDTRRKKKGIRKLISRFFDGGSSTNRKEKSSGSDHHGKAAAPSMLDLSYLSSTGDPNEPLKPPDRRFLGGVRGARRDRSSSSSSLSSFPHSPKEGSADVTFRRPSSVYFDQPSSPADSYHILATTSPATDLAPARGMVSASLQSEKSLPTVLQDKGPSPTLRREKSLPALPDEHFHIAGDHKLRVSSPICIQEPVELHGSHPSSRTDNYSFDASRSFVDVDDGDSIGGGRRSKARTKIFGMPFRKRKDVRDSDVFPSMPSKSEVLAVRCVAVLPDLQTLLILNYVAIHLNIRNSTHSLHLYNSCSPAAMMHLHRSLFCSSSSDLSRANECK